MTRIFLRPALLLLIMVHLVIVGAMLASQIWLSHTPVLAVTSWTARHADILLIDLTHNFVTALTDSPGVDRDPSWSIDGERIIYTSWRSDLPLLYTTNSDGRDNAVFTDDRQLGLNPVWSPDGSQIAFVAWANNRMVISLIASEAPKAVARPLLDGLACCPVLSWSPDGREIIFNGILNERPGLYRVDTESGAVRSLTTIDTGIAPTWSPDGSQIAFWLRIQDGFRLYVMDAEGENARPIIERLARDPAMAWLPDSSGAAYVYFENGTYVINIVSVADETVSTVYTHGSARIETLAWQPGSRLP